MKYQFIGRTTDFKGKTLWEIVGNLKNYGVGRIIIRNRFQRYPEPCYFKIMKVAALPTPVNEIKPTMINTIQDRKCIVLCEKTFRGKKAKDLVQIDNASYKADYQLIPKDEEYKYLESDKVAETKIVPRTMELPPLLRELTIRAMKAKGQPVTEEPQMELVYNKHGMKNYRVAEEGEKPTVKPTIGLGTPISPQLYVDVKPI